MRVLVTTGGTAGHIFPALATIESLYKYIPDVEVLFVGATQGLESKLAKQASIPFQGLPVRGFMGKGILSSIKSFFLLLYSVLLALKIILRYKPTVIVGFGGYASLPSLLVGKLLCKPIVLHEQNSIPGTVTRLLAPYSHTLCVSFEDTKTYFSRANVVYTGNPIRSTLQLSDEKMNSHSFRNILVMGGSLGAMKINTLMLAIAPLLLSKGFHIWHQTGMKHYKSVIALYEENGLSSVRVSPFIEDMQEAYTWADFALCRAGASTITELSMMAIPAIFIPFPHAIYNHQYHNAQSVVHAKAGLCLDEATITESILLDAIQYISTPSVFSDMKRNMGAFAKHSAGDNVAQQIHLICNRSLK
ncbi:MAG: undecaprenyldiphospho-muramoylpentapeptide beta-N-acetylglucosaminyltransferase [Desulfovibrionaceae bacterium]|nr:undecaprenyldiphospho-muramoylpentapeptide beta-N-acetylglucosaminyltransferase [Desulfovibrionaceae bacterium]